MWRTRFLRIPVVLAVLFVASPALGAPEDFPRSPALEPKIEFWKRVGTAFKSKGKIRRYIDVGRLTKGR